MTNPSTAELYDGAADTWVRTEPVLLSDYTARPFVLERPESSRARASSTSAAERATCRDSSQRGHQLAS